MRSRAGRPLLVILAWSLCSLAVAENTPSRPSEIERAAWNHFPDKFSWWPDFASMVWNSPIWLPGFTEELEKSASAKLIAYEFLNNISNFAGYSLEFPLENTVRPVELKVDCSNPDYKQLLTGQPRARGPRQIIMGFHFSAELYLLRARLAMYWDIVDKFVLHEATTTQHDFVRKPLVFERHKSKYQPWLTKILHLVHDDGHAPGGLDTISQGIKAGQSWEGDSSSRLHMYRSILSIPGLSDDDIVVYGDADEFAGEDLLFQLKHCELLPKLKMPISSNIAFYQHDFRNAFFSDWPASDQFPYGFQLPTIWTISALKASNGTRFRYFGINQPHATRYDGFHLSTAPFIPAIIFKYVGCPSYGFSKSYAAQPGKYRNVTNLFNSFKSGSAWKSRSVPARCLTEQGIVGWTVPWIFDQNPKAFQFMHTKEPSVFDQEKYVCSPQATEDIRKMRAAEKAAKAERNRLAKAEEKARILSGAGR